MENIEPLLTSIPVFKDLEPGHLQLLAGCASNMAVKEDQVIFREGEEANAFYAIRHGRVVVETYSPEQGVVGIQTCGPGDVLGWSWLVPPFKWHFDARAVEQSRLLALDGNCLRKKCEDDHNLGYAMMKIFTEIISDRLEATRLQLLDVYR